MPPKGWKGSKQETDIKQGRPAVGITKKVSITLDEDDWSWLMECVDFGHAKSLSEMFRKVVRESRGYTE